MLVDDGEVISRREGGKDGRLLKRSLEIKGIGHLNIEKCIDKVLVQILLKKLRDI